MITLTDLIFNYRTSGFQMRVDALSIAKGEKVALVGASGTGKTTLLHLMAGVLMPASGKVEVAGIDITEFGYEDRQDLRALKMGLIFQEFELLEYLNVLDNILLPYRISPILPWRSKTIQRAQTLASRVGLGEELRRHPAQLSQGERQRVAVCRALVTEPALIFGDEPTGNLDARNRDHVMEILFEYAQQTAAPLIIVTHDHELLARFDRRIDVQEFAA